MRYVATGRVHPERADISFSHIKWNTGDGGTISASCDASQVAVVFDTPRIDGFATAHIAATHFAYMVVAALGFALGSGYSGEIVQVTEENGTPHVMGVRPGTLEFDPYEPVFDRAVRLASDDLFFRLALRDYSRAVVDAEDCATYCYRAIESIKSSFDFRTGKDSWDVMHATLGTDRHSIESTIKTYADPVRHGNWTAAKTTTAGERIKMLQLTKQILAKYLDHEKPRTRRFTRLSSSFCHEPDMLMTVVTPESWNESTGSPAGAIAKKRKTSGMRQRSRSTSI